MMFCAGSAAHNFTRDQRVHIKKMADFSLRLDLAIEVNRHFLENECGEKSVFFCFELSNKFFYVK